MHMRPSRRVAPTCADTALVSYDPSPHSIDTPLSLEEVDAIVAEGARSLARNSAAVYHLARRMGVTMRAYRQQLRKLNNDIQMIRSQMDQTGRATTLNPADAVRFLSPDQLVEMVEGHLRTRVRATEGAWRQALETTETAERYLARAKQVLDGIVEDTTVADTVKEQARALSEELSRLPKPTPPAWVVDEQTPKAGI